MEVGRKYASLGRVCRGQEEVKQTTRFFTSIVLNQSLVNDASRRWVPQTAIVVLHEEPLRDALVDDNNRDLGHRGCLVVNLVDCSLELRDLSGKHLVTHSVTDTVTVQDEVCWELLLVELGKHVDRIFQCILHLALHDLLAFLLDDVFRIVLTQLLVG